MAKRRRIGWYSPYMPEQYETLHQAFIRLVRDKERGERAFERLWPIIRAAAETCEQEMTRSRARSRNPNPFRKLKAAAKKGSAETILSASTWEADALLYGAMRAGVLSEEAEYSDLEGLTESDLRKAVEAAIGDSSMLRTRRGRRGESRRGKSRRGEHRSRPIDNLAIVFARCYSVVSKKPLPRVRTTIYQPGKLYGRSLEYFCAACAPFVTLNAWTAAAMIVRARRAARQRSRRLPR
jgi:hypothetical protein